MAKSVKKSERKVASEQRKNRKSARNLKRILFG